MTIWDLIRNGESVKSVLDNYKYPYQLKYVTPMMYAVQCGNHSAVTDLLPYEIGFVDKDGQLAYDYALLTGDERLISLLVTEKRFRHE